MNTPIGLLAALKEAHAALVMMTQPDAINKTTISDAYLAAMTAEVFVRKTIEAVQRERDEFPLGKTMFIVRSVLSAHAPYLSERVIEAAALAADRATAPRNPV